MSDDAVLTLLGPTPSWGLGGRWGLSSSAEQRGAGLVTADPVRRPEIEGPATAGVPGRFGFPFIIAVKGLGTGRYRRRPGPRAPATATATEPGREPSARSPGASPGIRVEAVLDLVTVAVPVDGDRLRGPAGASWPPIGATASGGVGLEAYRPEDVAARTLVAGWMVDAGLDVEVGAAANLVGRVGPGAVAGRTGSHLDTVVDAGAARRGLRRRRRRRGRRRARRRGRVGRRLRQRGGPRAPAAWSEPGPGRRPSARRRSWPSVDDEGVTLADPH